jgi:aspartate aminotransferase-like enzyme
VARTAMGTPAARMAVAQTAAMDDFRKEGLKNFCNSVPSLSRNFYLSVSTCGCRTKRQPQNHLKYVTIINHNLTDINPDCRHFSVFPISLALQQEHGKK